MSNFFTLTPEFELSESFEQRWDGVLHNDNFESSEDFHTGPWHRGEQLTVSFAPDGTDILGRPSSLFESFSWMLDEHQLQEKVLQAFQAWSRLTNLNVGLVSDEGLAFGTPGLEQHDQRFGDVRIGAIELPQDVFAVAIPVDDLAAGTWAGEIVFNSAADFSGVRNFFQVALHESGHVFGLPHSDDVNSPMHSGGNSISLTAGDREAIKGLYGSRRLDINEDNANGNNSIDDATSLKYPSGSDADKGETPLVAFGDLVAGDVDFFEVNLPSDYSGRLVFRLDTIGLSLMAPNLAMYNEDGEQLAIRTSKSTVGDSLLVTIPETENGEKYYAKVWSNQNRGVFRVGSYVIGAILTDNQTVGWKKARRIVDTGKFALEEQSDFQQALLQPDFEINRDLSTNETFATAQLIETTSGFEDQTRYEVQGSMESLLDIDIYSVRTTETGIDGLTNMTIRVDSLLEDGFIPGVSVFDSNQNRVSAATLVNSNGQLSVQAKSVNVNEDYFIRISSNGLSPSFSTGEYRMTVDFSDEAAGFRRFAVGGLTVDEPIADHSLHVAESQILHINLGAKFNAAVNNALIWLTIYDENGEVYFRSATHTGNTRSANSILFSPGSYAVKMELALPDGVTTSTRFEYLVRGRNISDSQGPKLLDTTESPFDQCNPPSPEYCYPDDNHSADPYVFVVGGHVEVEPPESPWVDVNQWYWFDDWLINEIPPDLQS